MGNLLWKPLLAATLPVDYDFDKLPYPLLGSPKINGYRCMIQRGRAVTRNGELIRNDAVQQLFGNNNLFEGLDGELTIGYPWEDGVFNRTQQVVMNGSSLEKEKQALEEVKFNVFDYMSRTTQFLDRYLVIAGIQGISAVKQTLIHNTADFLRFETRCLGKGYEGVMLRRANAGPYPQKSGKQNRSTLTEFELVKFKRWEYDLVTIMAWHPLEHNLNEEKNTAGKRSSKKAGIIVDKVKVGSLTVRLGKLDFDLTVPTEGLRSKGHAWWDKQIGKKVTLKYQPHGMKTAPQFPTSMFKELL